MFAHSSVCVCLCVAYCRFVFTDFCCVFGEAKYAKALIILHSLFKPGVEEESVDLRCLAKAIRSDFSLKKA